MGWEPATAYAYRDGVMVGSRTEPEWDARERALMLALAEYEAGQCNKCGGHLPETTDPLHDADNPRSRATYVPVEGTPMQCHRCVAQERSVNTAKNGNPRHPDALIHSVHLVPRPNRR